MTKFSTWTTMQHSLLHCQKQ